MTADKSKMNRKKLIYHPLCSPSSNTIPIDMPTMNTQRNLLSLLISRSILPTFVVYSEPFISDLVSLPV